MLSFLLHKVEVSISPASSHTDVVDLHVSLATIQSLPVVLTIKSQSAAGTVVLFHNFPRVEVTSHTPPPASLGSPHKIYQIRGLEGGGKRMRK